MNLNHLKTKGVLSNPVILKCKEQSCILHTVRLPDYILKIQKVLFSASRMAACEVGHVQSLTLLAHMSKEMCQFSRLGIKAKDTNCPKLTGVLLLIFGCNFVHPGVELLMSLLKN